MELARFEAKDQPTLEEVEYFQKYGCIYYKNFFNYESDIGPIQKSIYELIDLVSSTNNISLDRLPYSNENFDSGLQYLLKANRSLGGRLYDVCKAIPAYISLASHKRHESFAKALLKTPLVGFAPRGYGIRMDHPNEEKFLTQLHQDYVSQLCSQNGVVYWSPLRHTDQLLGPVTVYLESHKSGVFPIIKHEESSKGLMIKDEAKIRNQFNAITPEVGVTDCVIIHHLTLHESSPNLTQKTRWAMISRYFDFYHPSGAAYGWKGGIQEGNYFDKVHPELTTLA